MRKSEAMVSNAELQEAQKRIERFKRLGGVLLGGLEPLERRFLRSEIITGLANYRRKVFTYVCPICGRVERLDQEMEPACTGPSWMDEHPLEPMVLKENLGESPMRGLYRSPS